MDCQKYHHPKVNRRFAIQAGSIGLLGLGMNHVEALQAAPIQKRYATTGAKAKNCLLYTSPSPRDATLSRMPSSA